jgi:hypothetical protein
VSEPIQPALTAAQWASVGEWNPQPAEMSNSYLGDSVSDYDGYVNERHALAALALYGQPFGFKREDVQLLHDVAFHLDHRQDQQERLDDLAERIKALLPPE